MSPLRQAPHTRPPHEEPHVDVKSEKEPFSERTHSEPHKRPVSDMRETMDTEYLLKMILLYGNRNGLITDFKKAVYILEEIYLKEEPLTTETLRTILEEYRHTPINQAHIENTTRIMEHILEKIRALGINTTSTASDDVINIHFILLREANKRNPPTLSENEVDNFIKRYYSKVDLPRTWADYLKQHGIQATLEEIDRRMKNGESTTGLREHVSRISASNKKLRPGVSNADKEKFEGIIAATELALAQIPVKY